MDISSKHISALIAQLRAEGSGTLEIQTVRFRFDSATETLETEVDTEQLAPEPDLTPEPEPEPVETKTEEPRGKVNDQEPPTTIELFGESRAKQSVGYDRVRRAWPQKLRIDTFESYVYQGETPSRDALLKLRRDIDKRLVESGAGWYLDFTKEGIGEPVEFLRIVKG